MKRDSRFDGSDRNGRETTVTRRALLRTGAAGLATTVGLAGLTSPVAAEQGAIFDLFENDGESSSLGDRITRIRSSFGGAWDRITADAGKRTAPESAAETTSVFNANAGTLVDYANAQLSSTREKTRYDTIRVVFENDETARRWITATVDDANTFTGASMTDQEPSREIDQWVRLSGLAATNAPDELERFVENYASENKPVDARLEGRLAGKYGPDVKSSLL